MLNARAAFPEFRSEIPMLLPAVCTIAVAWCTPFAHAPAFGQPAASSRIDSLIATYLRGSRRATTRPSALCMPMTRA